MNILNRRSVLRGTGLGTAGFMFSRLFDALREKGPRAYAAGGYGPLVPTADQTTGLNLLTLPAGFSYFSFGWRGDAMTNGSATPGGHDGAACFLGGDGLVYYVRNHELEGGGKWATGPSYDNGSGACGGTTTVVVNPNGSYVKTFPSLTGTIRNCAGGPTPWQSWLTCEENLGNRNNTSRLQNHGFTFEVPAFGVGLPTAITDMGRFNHEAAAVDPVSGFVYQTEDQGFSGIYRYKPNVRQGNKAIPPHEMKAGDLAKGGTLWMLKILEQDKLDTTRVTRGAGEPPTFHVDWVRIADPTKRDGDGKEGGSIDGSGKGVFEQGWDRGCASFRRGEGMWYGEGKIYFACTSGGPSGQGQIWELDPAASLLRMIYDSPSAGVLSNPDNVAVSPAGGLVLCEDSGEPVNYMRGLNASGEIFPIAGNNIVLSAADVTAMGRPAISPGSYTGQEFAGASFAQLGDWLLVSIQSPGVTFAITGPWENAGL